jgi:tetratricopeptide (TPR) repeat protein
LKAAELDQGHAKRICNVGNCLSELKRYAEAKPYFEKALELEPSNQVFRDNLKWILKKC